MLFLIVIIFKPEACWARPRSASMSAARVGANR